MRLAAAWSARRGSHGQSERCQWERAEIPRGRGHSLTIEHRDVIPATLLERLAGSLGPITLVVEARTDRVVGWVEFGADADADADADAGPDTFTSQARSFLVRALLGGLAPGLAVCPAESQAASRPAGHELAFVEGFLSAIPVAGSGASTDADSVGHSREQARADADRDRRPAHGEPAASAGSREVVFRAYFACDAFVPEGRRDARGARRWDLAIELSVCAGRTWLDLGSIRALEPGDLVTLDIVHHARMPVFAPGLVSPLWVELHDGVFRRAPDQPAAHLDEDLMHDPTDRGLPDEHASDSLVGVDALAIELVVELARITTSVAALEQLAVGAVLASGRPVQRTVTLRSRGQAVAEGELVELDGELGVRITAVAANEAREPREAGDATRPPVKPAGPFGPTCAQ